MSVKVVRQTLPHQVEAIMRATAGATLARLVQMGDHAHIVGQANTNSMLGVQAVSHVSRIHTSKPLARHNMRVVCPIPRPWIVAAQASRAAYVYLARLAQMVARARNAMQASGTRLAAGVLVALLAHIWWS